MGRNIDMDGSLPIGIKLLAGFFAFGAFMCALTVFLLISPGTLLDQLWALNPEARQEFQSIGALSAALMLIVGSFCGATSLGLACGKRWAAGLGVALLSVNMFADLLNAFVRHDYRLLIGVPISGGMILYLFLWVRRSTTH